MSTGPGEQVEIDDMAPDDHEGARSSSESDGDPAPPVALMVVSRARRSNAGNRMSTLLANAAEEDVWGEEWEEVANEEEFVGDDANEHDDYNLDSSSDEDEDAGDEDDAGEKELRKAERQERNKKRKTATNPFAARLAGASSRPVHPNWPIAT
jgi:vacuolar protein sorting-associated protein 72